MVGVTYMLLVLLLCLSGCAAGEEATPGDLEAKAIKKDDKPKEDKPNKPVEPPPVVVPPVVEPPPVTPPSTLVTYNFTGAFGEFGTVNGTLTYDTAAPALATNVRNLAPNTLYALKSWSFIVNTAAMTAVAPSTVYSSDIQGDTAELCMGACVFSAGSVTQLVFRNKTAYLLQLVFTGQWGTMEQSVYRVPCPVCVPVMLLSGGQVNQEGQS